MFKILSRITFFVLALAPVAFAATPQTLLTLNSQPGDFVGQGNQYSYTPADGNFNFFFTSLNGSVRLWFYTFDNSQSWDVTIQPPVTKTLTKGIYEYAQRALQPAPFPGLSVDGIGRGCNTDTGRFFVSDISISTSGVVERLAVDFEQHCEGAAPALYGSLRYNSTAPVVSLVSIANANVMKGNTGTNAGNAIVSLSVPSTEIVTADFATADGTATQDQDYTSVSGTVQFQPGITSQTISVPILGNSTPRGNLSLHLNLSNPSGAPVGVSEASMRFLDPNIAMTALAISSQPGDPIGHGDDYLYVPIEGGFLPSVNGDNGVTIQTQNSGFWSVDFAAPNRSPLTAGSYYNAQLFPFQNAGSPGLSVAGFGTGCDSVNGQFVIHNLEINSPGIVQHFSADFAQHCNGIVAALFGWIRINALLRQISISDAVIDTGTSTAVFTVALHPVAQAPVSVRFTTADGTALAGVDYELTTKTINFAPGTTSVTVSVPVRTNTDSGKVFYGQLSAPTGAPVWISQGVATF